MVKKETENRTGTAGAPEGHSPPSALHPPLEGENPWRVPRTPLRKRLDAVLAEYLRAFCKKNGASADGGDAVGGDLLAGPVCIADCYLPTEAIVYDVDHGLPPGLAFDWYWEHYLAGDGGPHPSLAAHWASLVKG